MAHRSGPPRKYPVQTVVDIYASGISALATGKMLGIHHTTVLYALKQAGIKTRPRQVPGMSTRQQKAIANRLARAARNEEICKMYSERGMSILQISRSYGRHHSTVLAVLQKAGVAMRRPGRPSPAFAGGMKEGPQLEHSPVSQEAREKQRQARIAICEQRNKRIERMTELALRISKRKARLCA